MSETAFRKRYYMQSNLMEFREKGQSDKRLDWGIIMFPERDSSCSEMLINPLQNSTFWKSEAVSRKRLFSKYKRDRNPWVPWKSTPFPLVKRAFAGRGSRGEENVCFHMVLSASRPRATVGRGGRGKNVVYMKSDFPGPLRILQIRN